MSVWAFVFVGYLLGGLITLAWKRPWTFYGPIGCLVFVVLWPLGLVFWVSDWMKPPDSYAPHQIVKRRDLTGNYTPADVEARETVVDPLGAAPEVAFGHLNAVWTAYRMALPDDVRFAAFSSAKREGGRLRILTGYAVRGPKGVGQIFVASDYWA